MAAGNPADKCQGVNRFWGRLHKSGPAVQVERKAWQTEQKAPMNEMLPRATGRWASHRLIELPADFACAGDLAGGHPDAGP